MNRSMPLLLSLTVACISGTALAGQVSFKDPKNDDNGPGSYIYPTKSEYKKGSFDLTELTVAENGSDIEVNIGVNAAIEDPWDSAKWPEPGNGFSLQMFQVYADCDGKAGSGESEALPGMNAQFADSDRWEKAMIISPQSNKRVQAEIDQKAKSLKDKILLPKKVSAKGKRVTAWFAKKDFGTDPAKCGWQVLVGSNEGFPAKTDILSRKVNELEGEHRFGGGDDGDIDANFVDALAGKGTGGTDEVAVQHDMLKFDAKARRKAQLKVVRN